MAYLWMGLVVVFCAAEAVTMQLVSIWFAGGALVSAVTAVFGLNRYWQMAVFLAVSVLLLVLTRPLAKRLVGENGTEKTNADRIIGEKVIITNAVDNMAQTGETVVNGVAWTVRSADGERIEKGSVARVEKIEGVKLIVSKAGEKAVSKAD